jgi:hypothetical protein
LVGAARFPFCIAFNRLPEREQLGSSDRLPGTVRTRSARGGKALASRPRYNI